MSSEGSRDNNSASEQRRVTLPIIERTRTREGSISLQYPMLNRNNYAAWAIKMKVYMEAQGVWDAVEPAAGVAAEFKKDKMALAAIYQGISEDALLLLADKKTAKEAWDNLKTMHLGADRVRNAKVQTLKSEFEMLRMKDEENIDDFSMMLASIVNKIRSLGDKMEEAYVVRKFLRAVPERFLQVVSTIEQFGDIENMSMEEVIGRLKAHEERVGVFEYNTRSHLLLTQEHEVSKRKRKKKKGRDKTNVKCFNCDEYGHYASDCPQSSHSEEEVNLASAHEDEPTLLMAMIVEEFQNSVSLNEDVQEARLI